MTLKGNYFLIFLLITAINALGQPNAFILDSSSRIYINSLLKLEKNIINDETIYIVNYDANDCGNCLNSIYNLKNTHSKQTIILTNHFNKEKIQKFKQEYGLSDSFIVLNDPILKLNLEKYYQNNTVLNSWIIKIKSNIIQSIPLKEFHDSSSFPKNMLDKNINSYKLSDSNTPFYSGFSKGEFLNNVFYGISFPKSTLLIFNDTGAFISKPELDSNQIQNIYKFFINSKPDSVQKINSFSQSMSVFNNQLKPNGFNINAFHNIYKFKDSIFIISYISFPIKSNDSTYDFLGTYYVANIINNSGIFSISNIKLVHKSISPNYTVFAGNHFSILENSIKIGLSYNGFYDSTISLKNSSITPYYEYFDDQNEFYTLKNDTISGISFTTNLNKLKNLGLISNSINTKNNVIYYRYLPYFINTDSKKVVYFTQFYSSTNQNSFVNLYTYINTTDKQLYSIIKLNKLTYIAKLKSETFELEDLNLVDFGNKSIDLILEGKGQLILISRDMENSLSLNYLPLSKLRF
jgi:hypothetical protein